MSDIYLKDIKISCDNGSTWASVTPVEDLSVTNYNFKEELIMNNKVLQLYKYREEERLKKIFEEECKKAKNADKYIEEYNTLVEGFKTSLSELRDRANRESLQKVFAYGGYELDVPYVVHPEYLEEVMADSKNKYENDLKSLRELVNEIDAVLSLSDDKEYQLQVLKNYDILDKNGVMK